jgi:hypothetical protein
MNRIYLLAFIILSIGCSSRYEDSKIEVIKYDTTLIKSIEAGFKLIQVENLHREDFWTIKHYKKDSIEYRLMRDSLENVVAIVNYVNDKFISGKEYYTNGQLMGKTEFVNGKFDGKATYYFRDGRVKSTGMWKDYGKVGVWYNYDPFGKLDFIEHYDDSGKLKKKEKI